MKGRRNSFHFIRRKGGPLRQARRRRSFLSRALALAGILAIALGLGGYPWARAEETPQQVLVLHSYHVGFRWTDNVMQGVDSVFADWEAQDLELHVEYMDSKRHPPEVVFPKLWALYAAKYSVRTGNQPDVIITSDDNALRFILEYGILLFPDVPVVFCGVNHFQDEMLVGRDSITGVLEDFDILSTVELIHDLHPNATTLAVITDSTPTGKLNLEKFQALAPEFPEALHVLELSDMTTQELLNALEELGPDTAILNLSFFRDREGRAYSTVEGNRVITGATELPVYSCWDFYMGGTGVIGGKVVSGRQQGIEAATMALDILKGADVRDIPIMRTSPNVYIFDYPALAEAGLSVDDLPQDSVVLNRPESFYEKYKQEIYLVLAVFALMLISLVFMAMNNVQRRRAQKVLTQTVQELDTIFESSQVGIMCLQGGRSIYRVNQRLVEIFGYSGPDEMVGMSVARLHVSNEAFEEFGKTHYAALSSGRLIQVEYQAKRRDGTLFWVMVSGKAVDTSIPPDLDKGVIWVMDDITERKHAEEELARFNTQLEALVGERTEELHQRARELEEANQQLRKLDVMKSGFLSTVSHDLRTPLTSIVGFAKLINKDFSSVCQPDQLAESEERRKGLRIIENLTIIEQEAERLTRLVNDCLDLSRIEEGRQLWNDQPIQLADLVTQAMATVKVKFSKQDDLTFVQECPEELPHIVADPDRIVQVLVNLLNNAAKYSGRGEVRLVAEVRDNMIAISVSDQGKGIPKDDLETVFDKFYQVQIGDTVAEDKGSGMGLAICRQIVEHYGGRIWAESELGKGSTFNMLLPIAEARRTE
ncbi:MAG: PAS domain S-box protein [Desulfovibrio sp.]|nr:MAG: PAS domain S-box protein [Desulfovibrio sp.]